MNELSLYFADPLEPELVATCFFSERLERYFHTTRGKTSGAYPEFGSFTWTRGVKALTELLLRARLCTDTRMAHLSGGSGSAAVSLDYAINKEPLWLAEMFGADAGGSLFIKRLILRSNSDQRRKGPVALTLNRKQLTAEHIKIFLDERLLTKKFELEALLDSLTGSPALPGAGSPLPDCSSRHFEAIQTAMEKLI